MTWCVYVVHWTTYVTCGFLKLTEWRNRAYVEAIVNMQAVVLDRVIILFGSLNDRNNIWIALNLADRTSRASQT